MFAHKLNRISTGLAEAPVSRRGFLLGAAATAGGLAIGFRPVAGMASDKALSSPFDVYLTIGSESTVNVLASQFDMGQGAWHGIATLVVEELDADWDQVMVTGASGDPKLYGNLAWGGFAQGTGGSTSMVTSFERYRVAAATARAMLVAAASDVWGVPAGEITVSTGVIRHEASGKAAGFGEFAEAAAKQEPVTPVLKTQADWNVIGNPGIRRYDSAPKTNGTQEFTIDVMLPGMLTAVMIHPPKFGGKVASFDATAALAVDGVTDVVAIPRGVAVVARDMWTALKARDAVTVEWDFSEAETRGSDEIMSEYLQLSEAEPAAFARKDGDAAAALASADKVIEATYEFPYLAHAALEPLNAVARMNEDGTLDLWGGHQLPGLQQAMAAGAAGIEPSQVHMHILKTGGGFGRRATPDSDIAVEVAAIGKAIGWKAPVRLQWTRENDMRGGRYRPAYVHRMRAGLDAEGNIVGWENHIVGQSIVKGTPFAGMMRDGIDPTSVEGADNIPYAVPNISVGLTTTDVKVPVLWWRSVGHTHTAYTTETMIDRLAEAAGKDPVDFRLGLLKDHPRHAAVLKLAAEKAGWGDSLPEGRRLGVAVHESFATFAAQVVEVSVDGGEVEVHRVVAAVDCGIAINPDNIRAQIEGGIAFGLGAILQEGLTLTDGEVDQGNYDGYMPLRIDRMPDVEVHIVESTANPTGVGEPGVPPIGPAIANAVRHLTGKNVTRLPFANGLTA
jgi:isoquinoline 1-oxidoreductase beta subunit